MTESQTWKNLLFWKSTEWKELKGAIAASADFIVPAPPLIFRPLIQTRLKDVKVVLLQPEPYCKKDVANGLAFSYNGALNMAPVPFYFLIRELEMDVGVKPKRSDLSKWSSQGVLLWNCIPTTYTGTSGVHQGIGWERLTEEIVETVYLVNPKAVFVSFGPTTEKVLSILPQDANRLAMPPPHDMKFCGTRMFSTINKTLNSSGIAPVNWSV